MLLELYFYGRDVNVVILSNNKENLHEYGILWVSKQSCTAFNLVAGVGWEFIIYQCAHINSRCLEKYFD